MLVTRRKGRRGAALERSKAVSDPRFGTFVRHWPCVCGKKGYREREGAKIVVREMRRKGDRDPERLHSYQCDLDPDYFHVGHRAFNTANLNDPAVYS
jgi:hypothetical protein